MLFHLEPLEEEIHQTSNIKHQTSVWKLLLDKLRVSGLMDYWLSDEYHDAAATELAKVDWAKQPHRVKLQYEKPIWYLKAKRRFMQIGSYWKQKIVKL
jgi:transcription initiation factor IIE alpha subunit